MILGTKGKPRRERAFMCRPVEDAVPPSPDVRQILRAPDLKTRVAKAMNALDPTIDEAQVCVAMLKIDKIWDQLFPAEQERIVRC